LPLHKSEILCPDVPGKAIHSTSFSYFPLYRKIAEMQFLILLQFFIQYLNIIKLLLLLKK